MATESVLRAFLFTDIVGATALKSRIGDVAGANAITKHDALFRGCLERYNGEEQENPGDGFFASFSLPSDALRCGLAFQQGLANLELSEALQIRVGIHMGESVRVAGNDEAHRQDKLLGLAIDTTARVMGLAQAGQILLTRHAFDSVRQQVNAAPDGLEIQWLAHGPYTFKGVDEPIEIFEAGLRGISPLTPPPNTPGAQRVLAPGEEETLGWRPAIGQEIPGRESWELVRQIGQGGFGEVWLAQHSETRYVRTFKFCFETDKLRSLQRELKLFRLMKEVLGDRPDIARLYEVRLREAPYYLEMEYTAGGNLVDWAESRGGVQSVPLETRLELVAQVGEALAAAHSVGVIHKDVKPANILIHEDRDQRLQARLTDFGIGELLGKERLVDAGMTASTFESDAESEQGYGSRYGTQVYAAPELLSGQPSSIQTDVYALGVLLFQMVSGNLRWPIAHGWEQHVEDELLREDVAACVAGEPSARLRAADELSRRLRDLAQRRTERAATRKQVAREAWRRGLLRGTSVVAVVLLIVAGVTGVGLWQTERAREREELERKRAQQAEQLACREAEKAQSVVRFLQDMLASAKPSQARGRELTVREVLDQAAQTVDEQLAEEPIVAVAVHDVIGATYHELGRYDDAEQHLTAALKIAREEFGPEHPDALLVAANLGLLYSDQGKLAEAEALLRETLERQTRVLGQEHAETLVTMESLVNVLVPMKKLDNAEELYRKILAARRRMFGEDDETTLRALNNLAGFAREQGRLAEAEALFRETYELQMKALGSDHPDTLMTMSNLAGALKAQKKSAEAVPLYRQALEGLERVQGASHPTTLGAINNLASALMDLGRLDEAEPLYREALQRLLEAIGDQHPTTLITQNNLARLLHKRGKMEEAAELFVQLIETATGVLPEGHVYLALFRGTCGECLTDLGRYDEAENHLLSALEGVTAYYGAEAPPTLMALERLAQLYQAWDKPDQAAEFEARREAATQPAGSDDEASP